MTDGATYSLSVLRKEIFCGTVTRVVALFDVSRHMNSTNFSRKDTVRGQMRIPREKLEKN